MWHCVRARPRAGKKSIRPRVGLPTPAAWDVVGIGSYVWHDGALGRVRSKGHAGATIAVFTADVTPRRVTARTDVRFTMSSSEVVHYDLPPLLVDTASPTTSGRVRVCYHETQALRAVETPTSSARLIPAMRRLVALLPLEPPVGQTSSRMLRGLTAMMSL